MIAPRGHETREPAQISPTVQGLESTVGSFLNVRMLWGGCSGGGHEKAASCGTLGLQLHPLPYGPCWRLPGLRHNGS